MKRSGLIAFYGLTFAAVWGIALLFLVFPQQMTRLSGPISLWNPVIFTVVWIPTLLSPLLALAFDGVAGLRDLLGRFFRVRFKLRWYLIPTAGVAALALAARTVQALVTHTAPPPLLDVASWPALAWYGATMLVLDPGPIGEDPGWRGFALPRMLNEFNPAVAALLLGAIWAALHLPAFLFSGMPQSGLPLGWFFLSIVSTTVLMAWVSISAKGAVIPAILLHWAMNRFSDLGPQGAMYCAVAYLLAALAVIVVTRGRLGLPPGSRSHGGPVGKPARLAPVV